MRELWNMFWAFCTIGGLTFGGGYAMLPMLTKTAVEKYRWVTQEELLDYYAVGQCIPGIIAVNTAIFIGFKHRKVSGALACALGVILPSVVIITLIAMMLESVMDLPAVTYAFAGIRIAVGALIVSSVIKLSKASVKNWMHLVLCVAAFLIVTFVQVKNITIYVVLGTVVVGLVTALVNLRKQQKEGA